MQRRNKGGQPGNTNAVTHGRFSRATRLARLAEAEERHRKHVAWMKLMPKTNYAALSEAIQGVPKKSNS